MEETRNGDTIRDLRKRGRNRGKKEVKKEWEVGRERLARRGKEAGEETR